MQDTLGLEKKSTLMSLRVDFGHHCCKERVNIILIPIGGKCSSEQSVNSFGVTNITPSFLFYDLNMQIKVFSLQVWKSQQKLQN